MQNCFKGVLTSLLMLSAMNAQAHFSGPSSGGGGFVVDCAATLLEPAKVEMLDLYEARQKFSFIQATASMNLMDEYFLSVDRTYTLQGAPDLAEQRRVEIDHNVRLFFRSVKEVAATELPQAHDLGSAPWIPASCQIKQVAFFDDSSDTIYLDRVLFTKMDALNQAALIQHELWYKQMRILKDTTSELSRAGVGHIFAVRGVMPINDGIPAKSLRYSTQSLTANSTSEISSFQAFPMFGLGRKFLRMQFSQLHGRAQLTKTYVDMPWNIWDLKLGRSQSNPNLVGCIVQTPNQNIQHTVSVSGTMSQGLSLRYIYQTGEPISLAIINNGQVISEDYIGSNCKSPL